MNPDSSSDGAALAALIDQKLELLARLHEIARQQVDLVQQDSIAGLVGLLTDKQQQMRELEALQEALQPHQGVAPEARRWPDPEMRRRTRAASEQCDAVLAELLRLERQCEATLQQRRGQIAQQLQQTESSAQASRAYGASSPPRSGGRLDIAIGD